jgi:hypothetical protein
MKPQIVDFEDVVDDMQEDGSLPEGEMHAGGYAWRLSAPGYLDCTEWAYAASVSSAIIDCIERYDGELDTEDLYVLGSWLSGFEEFLEGYLYGLAFTATDSDGKSLYKNPGGDIRDVVDTDKFLKMFSEEDQARILIDCVSFVALAGDRISDAFGDAGSDFHLTRNRHGAGFQDGDWVHEEGLVALSRTFGECCVYEAETEPHSLFLGQ